MFYYYEELSKNLNLQKNYESYRNVYPKINEKLNQIYNVIVF